ncbi:MAG: hypothetical protein HRO68_07580 [Nitrosopumilus sp.]|nr:hypothetical protein [Nitrosopumilus sp.]
MNPRNSCALFGICPCCSVQLKWLGGLDRFDLEPGMIANGCKKYQGKPEPVPRFGKKTIDSEKIIKKKLPKRKIWIKIDSSKLDRNTFY